MRFTLGPVHEMGHPDETALALSIEAPSQRENRQSVEQFFQVHATELRASEESGEKIFLVVIVLRSAEGIGPTSPFLTALCSFLRHYPFHIAANRTLENPLRLMVQLASDEDNNDDGDNDVVHVTRADPVVQEATDRICAAFCGNDRVRAAERVHVDLPVAPTAELLDRLYADAAHAVAMRVSDHRRRGPGRVPDVLHLEMGSVQVLARGLVAGANAAKQVLQSTIAIPSGLRVHTFSPGAAGVMVECLNEFRNHSFRSISLFAVPPQDVGRPPSAATDGADLCRAVLRCPAVTDLILMGFQFYTSALAAVQEALAASGPGNVAALKFLSFQSCTFPDTAVGPAELAQAMSPNNKLEKLRLCRPDLRESGMKSLCSALTESDWELDDLVIGFFDAEGTTSVLEDEQVERFFQHLPFMKKLKRLIFQYEIPSSQSSTVVNGFKHNYWLCEVGGVSFAGDPHNAERLKSEIHSFVFANARGRTAIHRAVSNPNDQELQEEMFEVLHRLANSDFLDDASSLFLCLQVLLPNRGGAGRVAVATQRNDDEVSL